MNTNINIDGQHVEVTEPLKNYVKKRFMRIEDHFENITSVHVVLSVEKLEQKSEIQLHVKGKEIHASATDEDMYAAIDAMMDKVHTQAKKHKEKLKSRKDNNNLDDNFDNNEEI